MGASALGSCSLLNLDGHLLLVDVGPGSLDRLVASSVPFDRIDAVFLTHFHPDHVADLPVLIQFFVYGMEPKRTRPLYVVGGPGLTRMFVAWAEHFGSFVHPDHGPVRLVEVAAPDHPVPVRCEGLDLGAARVEAVHVDHKEASLAYRFTESDVEGVSGGALSDRAPTASLVLSGDTAPCETLVVIARSADLFFCECSFPDERPRPGHMTPMTVGETAQRAAVGTVMLTHLYPEMNPDEARHRVEALFHGGVVVAEQGLCASIEVVGQGVSRSRFGSRITLAHDSRCW